MTSSGFSESGDELIEVRGARVHNLKNVSVSFPRDALVVITGPSGSGKSSLAFDTIYAEGQRRYVESLSAYARQFLEQLGKPDLDSISGLSPTISIEQRTTSYNPRSTVGTITEVHDFLRVLFARVARPFCWNCGDPIHSQSPQQIVDRIMGLPEGSKVSLRAPVVRGRKGEYRAELAQLRQRGFVRARIDGETHDLSEDIVLDKKRKHDIDVYIDRLIVKGDKGTLAARVSDSVELALKLGKGLLVLEDMDRASETLLSERFACTRCGINYPEPEPRTFSFNSPLGACPTCQGLGQIAIEPAEPAPDLPEDAFLPKEILRCAACQGTRLRKEALSFKLGGRSIGELSRVSISALAEYFSALALSDRERAIGERVIKEISDRLGFLQQVGVGYLSLDRSAESLSGGEAQRIRLASQIGSSLVGVIYVLDEPSIGLHPRDNDRLLSTLFRLRDLGNSVLVVEHDRDTMERSDWILDLGPGAGHRGGEIVVSGDLKAVRAHKTSLTGRYLTGKLTIPTPAARRRWAPDRSILIEGASLNNLKNVTARFPLGAFICVTGVSGSGKSTLVVDTLYRLLLKALYKVPAHDLQVASSSGIDLIDKVIDIDQSPIGRTPRSNPATYTGLFSLIRELFARLPDSQIRGYKLGRFSFNVKGGRCETCEGDGMTRVQMHFLPDVFVECVSCKGRRYNRETLEIRYKGKNVADVLDMTAEEALGFFDAVPKIKTKLSILCDVGLGYIHLGQSATTLSGGEAQRIKLSKELSRRGTGKTVYILDEPTTGLHFDDVDKLVRILQQLVDQGNTVIVIEHNLDIIKACDHVIDMGPEGGEAGGTIVAQGTPEEVAAVAASHTGRFLKDALRPPS